MRTSAKLRAHCAEILESLEMWAEDWVAWHPRAAVHFPSGLIPGSMSDRLNIIQRRKGDQLFFIFIDLIQCMAEVMGWEGNRGERIALRR